MFLPGTFGEPSTLEEFRRSGLEAAPDKGEYLGAQVRQAFDRTTTARVMEESAITSAEKEEGTFDQAYAGNTAMQYTDPFLQSEPAPHTFAMTEEEWKNSEYYIPKAQYRPDMTVTRARIMKENYDERRWLELLVARGDESYGLGMKALGFGASLVGSLPDPVNALPFGGGIAASTVGKGLVRGAVEGMAGAAAVNMLALPDLARRGEDVGMADALMDIGFGAVLGGGLGGLGGYVGKLRQQTLHKALQNVRLEEAGKTAPEAAPPATLPRNEQADLLRAELDPASRRAMDRGMEKALADIHADRPVDVGPVLRETPTISEAQYKAFVSELEQGGATDVNFGTLRADLKEALNAIRTEEGVPLLEGDELIIPANVVKKLHEKRMLQGHMSADAVGELLLDVFHRDADFASSTKYPHIQAVVALREGLSEVGFISINPKTGETVIKTGYKEKTPKIANRLEGTASRPGEARNLPSGDDAGAPPFAAPRLSALQDGGTLHSGEAQHLPSGDDAGAPPFAALRLSALQDEESMQKIIKAPNLEVNYAVEAPDASPPAPPLSQEAQALADALGMDPATGLLPEEVRAAELDAAGRVFPEDRDALAAARQEGARVPDYDDIGQSIIPCILEVSDGK